MSYDPMAEGMLTMAIAMATGSASEALEAVETAEQNQARLNCRLPKKMRPTQEAFEALGFTFEDIGDSVLFKATLPDGWCLEEAGGYWTNLIDEKGRKRGSYFYKSAFYDRDGNMRLSQRFHATYDAESPEKREGPYTVSVKDADGTILFTAGQCQKAYSDEFDKLMEQAEEFLHTNYPEWKDPTKYWN